MWCLSYTRIAKIRISTAPNAGKDKERETPRKTRPHSKENSGETERENEPV